MQIILASAKIMNDKLKSIPDISLSLPRFHKEADDFARDMAQYSVETIADMLGCSRQIAVQNRLRYMNFFGESPKLPAILAYHGQAYKHLRAETLNVDALNYSQGKLSGNMHQWGEGYPSETVIMVDMEKNSGFVLEDGGKIVGYFAFLPSPEPTYYNIYKSKWLNDEEPYHVVHRIASYPDAHGIFSSIMEYCFSHDPSIRIDTHRDNKIMQHNITKHGFTYCVIIYLASGDEWLAYQKKLNH